MLPEKTAQAFFDLKGMVLQPIHYATYNLAFHPWYEPMERVTSEAKRKDASIVTPVAGQIVNYKHSTIENHWWSPAMERSKNRLTQPGKVVYLSQQEQEQ